MYQDTEWLSTCIATLEREIREWEMKKFMASYKSVVKLCEDEIWERQQQIEEIKREIERQGDTGENQ